MGNKPIVHAPIATGSTEPRDIRDRFADFVNLKDFGAVGDGVTDDSAAWAAWQTAVKNGGKPYIPSGEYLLDDEIVHAPNGVVINNTVTNTYSDDGIVLDATQTVIYVDSNGDDTNDGLLPDSPVASFARAIQIANASQTNKCKLVVSAGSYTENIDIANGSSKIIIHFLGDVTVNGYIQFSDFTCGYFTGEDSDVTLTVNGNIVITNKSFLYSDIAIIINYSGTVVAFSVQYSSYLYDTKSIECNTSGSGTCFYCQYNSFSYLKGGITVHKSTNGDNGIQVAYKSCMFVSDHCTISDLTNSNSFWCGLVVSNSSYFNCSSDFYVPYKSVRSSCIFVFRHSHAEFSGENKNINLYGSTTSSNPVIYVSGHSFLLVAITGSDNHLYSRTAYNNQRNIYIEDCSLMTCTENTALATVTESTASNFNSRCYVDTCSAFYLGSDCSWWFGAGTVSGEAVVAATRNSVLQVKYNATISNGSVTGKRYVADLGGCISVQGKGANRFPGSTAGTTATNGVYA